MLTECIMDNQEGAKCMWSKTKEIEHMLRDRKYSHLAATYLNCEELKMCMTVLKSSPVATFHQHDCLDVHVLFVHYSCSWCCFRYHFRSSHNALSWMMEMRLRPLLRSRLSRVQAHFI